jgi:hypothetical protein
MDEFVQHLFDRRSKPNERIFCSGSNMQVLSVFEKSLVHFACLSTSDLKKYTSSLEDFKFLSFAQCMAKDLLALKSVTETEYLQTKQPCSSFWKLRTEPKQLFAVRGFAFYGCKEPVRSKQPSRDMFERLVSKLRYIHDVLHVRVLIVLEARNFEQEAHAWDLVCASQKAKLIAIEDWRVPHANCFVAFIEALEDARQRGLNVLGHCIAGNGRTGFCLLFAMLLRHEVFDITTLLCMLSEQYKKDAAVEIITMAVRNKISIAHLYATMQEAHGKLRESCNHEFFQALQSPWPKIRVREGFSEDQRRYLAKKGLKSRS